MKLGEYLQELLVEHDVVHIPGLGGFVGSYLAAQPDPVAGVIHPPSKKLEFDQQLGVDDGLLINLIREQEALSYEAARQALDQEVKVILEVLRRKETVSLPGIGNLYLDYDGQIQFEAKHGNLHPNAFGLAAVSAKPVAPTATSTIPASQPTVAQSPGVTATPLAEPWYGGLWFWLRRNAVLVITAVTLGIVVALIFANRDRWRKPDLTANIPTERLNVPPVASEDTDEEEALDFPSADSLETAPGVKAPADSEAATPVPGQKVAIIGIGLFGDPGNVDRLIQRIYAEGFEPYTEKKGNLTRVGIQFGYTSEREIQDKLLAVRKSLEPGAIVLRR